MVWCCRHDVATGSPPAAECAFMLHLMKHHLHQTLLLQGFTTLTTIPTLMEHRINYYCPKIDKYKKCNISETVNFSLKMSQIREHGEPITFPVALPLAWHCFNIRSFPYQSSTLQAITDAVQCSSRCTLADIEACVTSCAARMGVEVQLFQSSDVARCIQRLQSAQEDAVVINPGRCVTNSQQNFMVRAHARHHTPQLHE